MGIVGVLLVVIAVIAICWYRKKQNSNAEQSDTKLTSSSNAVEVLRNDETTNQYYVIACGLFESIKKPDKINGISGIKYIKPVSITFDGIKQYIEFHIQQPCNTEKLETALGFFCKEAYGEVSLYSFDKKHYELLGLTIDDISLYKHSKEEAYNICFSEIVESIKTDCKEIFNVVASHGIEHFDTGWRRKNLNIGVYGSKYTEKIGLGCADELFRQKLIELFLEGNDTVRETLCDRFAYYSHCARNQCYVRHGGVHSIEKALPTIAEHAGAVTIRALHFEKYGECREAYKTITEDDCHEFVSNCDAFKRINEQIIGSDPFSERAKNWAKNLAESKFSVFDKIKSYADEEGSEYLPFNSECYYLDALCNAFWKWVAEDYKNGDSTDPNDIFEILLDYFEPGEAVLNDLKDIDDRREALRRQCNSCAYNNSCKEKQENCKAYFPKQK